jgi:hypothetical protein
LLADLGTCPSSRHLGGAKTNAVPRLRRFPTRREGLFRAVSRLNRTSFGRAAAIWYHPFRVSPESRAIPETIHKAASGKLSIADIEKAPFRYAAMRPTTCDDAIAGGASLKNISVGEPSLWLTRMLSPR